MLNKRGFTLVEIIVSIALLGILSVGFLTVISNNLNFIQQNRETTETTFVMQREMEIEIADIKQTIVDDPLALGSTQLTDVFESGIDVNIYEVSYTDSSTGRTMNTVITNAEMPTFDVPEVETISATLRYNDSPVTHLYPVSEGDVYGEYTLGTEHIDELLVTNTNWYVSREGFNIPFPNTVVPEYEMGTKYPSFPNDYVLIPEDTDRTLDDITSYGNRHIVFTATPAAKSGKIGETVASDPVFISGLPIYDSGSDVILHLDGVMIDQADSTYISEESDEYKVEKWLDTSDHSKDAEKYSDASRPTMIEFGVDGDFVGKYVDFDASEHLGVDHDSSVVVGEELYVFAVAKGLSTDAFMVNGSFSTYVTGEAISNGWTLVSPEIPTGSYTADSDIFDIGNNDLDIAEIVIYKGALTQTEIDEIEDYLRDKYMPLDYVGEIISLFDMADEVYQNDTFVMPTGVLADLAYGPNSYVAVTWNHDIDTSVVGLATATGTSVQDDTKSMTLSVNVLEPIHPESITVTPSTLSLLVGEEGLVEETVLPDEAFDKSVTWSSSDSAIAEVDSFGVVLAISEGVATITATTVDGGYEATCVVTVYELLDTMPTDYILHLDPALGIETDSSDRVEKWNDQSDEDNDFVQTNGNYKPTVNENVRYGLDTILFDGNDFLTFGTHTMTGVTFEPKSTASDFSIFIIAQADDTSSNETFFSKSGGWGTYATYTFGMSYDDKFQHVLKGDNANNKSSYDSDKLFDYNLHTSIWDGSDHNYWINYDSISGHDNINAEVNQSNNIAIGGAGSGYVDPLNGSIGEIIIYDRTLSDEDRDLVEAYLMEKWIVPQWNFNDSTEGWDADNDLDNYTANDYTVSADFDSTKGRLRSPDNLDIDSSDYRTLKIRMKISADTNGSYSRIDFITNADGNFGGDTRLDFTPIMDGEFHEYYIDMSVVSKWTASNLRRMKFFPCRDANTGSFEIDYIKIIE